MNKGKRKGRGAAAPATIVLLELLEQALPEQCRDERGAASNPAPTTGKAVLLGPSSPRQAGLQAVVLDLRTHPHHPLPGQPVVEVVVRLYAPLLLGRVRPGTEVTIGTKRAWGIAQMSDLFLVQID